MNKNKGPTTDNQYLLFRYLKNCLLIWPVLLLAGAFPAPAYAHRGAGDQVDACNIRVGYERVHFTAYTPTLTGNREYCKTIPELGPTNLVFDYEGKNLRNFTVQFEVTKEPEGTRIFYQEPKKIKSGTANGVVDFSQYGADNYLVHVAIVHNGKELDAHIPFSVGLEDDAENPFMPMLLTIAGLLVLLLIMIWMARAKNHRHSSPEDLTHSDTNPRS